MEQAQPDISGVEAFDEDFQSPSAETDEAYLVDILDIYIGDRRRKEYGDVEDLARDMRANGQIQPIAVRPTTEEESKEIEEPWILMAGGRRLHAAMMLGWLKIAAFVRRDIEDEIQHRVIELHENLKRQAMSWQEEADAKREILELRREQNPEITNKEVAREIGDNPASFSRSVAASEAMEENPELRKASSRKAALRAKQVADKLEARKRADEKNREALEEVESRIVTDDAVNFLEKYEGFFDVMVTDPPYGIEFWKQGQKDEAGDESLSGYDDSRNATYQLYREVFPAMARAMRSTGWVLIFGSAESYQEMFKVWTEMGYTPEIIPWIWYRENSRNNPRNPELHAKNMYEWILVVNMGDAMLTKPTENVFVCDAEYGGDRVHGNQKPFDLIVALLTHVAYPGDRFCDPFFGSGSHLAAAASMSMHAHGCDLNPAMRKPALGLVAQHFKPIPPSVRELSEVRFQRRLAELAFDKTEGPAAEE